MKLIMEGWRGYLTEGQRGTDFEHVVVAIAQGDLTGGTNGALLFGATETKPGIPFADLAKQSLEHMGYSKRKIRNSSPSKPIDPNARIFSTKGAGISGRPKTDIIINGKRISLKLPKDIQFASGEGASTAEAIKLALQEYLQSPAAQIDAQKAIVESLKTAVADFSGVLAQTTKKLYLPADADTPESESYLLYVAKKAQKDWMGTKEHPQGKWPSAGIPKQKSNQGPPQSVYPQVKDYVNYYQTLALTHAFATDRIASISYNKFKDTITTQLQEKAATLAGANPAYYNIIIDEWLTGRRQFKGTEGVAEWLLSPDGFYDIRTLSDTATLAQLWKDYIKWRPAAKGRTFASKAITIRIDFHAEKYYEALRKATEAEAAAMADLLPPPSGSEWTEAPIDLVVTEGQTLNSEVERIAQRIASEAMSHVVFGMNNEVEPEVS